MATQITTLYTIVTTRDKINYGIFYFAIICNVEVVITFIEPAVNKPSVVFQTEKKYNISPPRMNTNLPTSGVWSATVTPRKLTARRLCFLCNWKLSVLCNIDNYWPYFSRSSLNQDQDKFLQELCRWGWKHYNNIALKIELDSSNFFTCEKMVSVFESHHFAENLPLG